MSVLKEVVSWLSHSSVSWSMCWHFKTHYHWRQAHCHSQYWVSLNAIHSWEVSRYDWVSQTIHIILCCHHKVSSEMKDKVKSLSTEALSEIKTEWKDHSWQCWEQCLQIDNWQNLYWGAYLFWARQLSLVAKSFL